MSSTSYPPSDLSHLARRVQNAEVSSIRRDWTGNDKSARNHHGVVSLRESPLRLRLNWKGSPDATVKLVGIFDLDLPKLLADGYVRLETGMQDSIRLRFYHSTDDLIYIQTNNEGRGLPVGEIS